MIQASPRLAASEQQSLYRCGVRTRIAQRTSGHDGLAAPDFCLMTQDSYKKLAVLWLREEDLLGPAAEAQKRCVEIAAPHVASKDSVVVVLATRNQQTMAAFKAVQSWAFEQEVRCIPVTAHIKTVAWALRYLERNGSGSRKAAPVKFNVKHFEATCTAIPRVGRLTCTQNLLPKAKTLKAVFQLAKTSPDPALRPIRDFLTQTL
mmetsp:Transcript_1222/g.2958  ORF Transcript_1222/g.2958 Transcript_1222/m.2958 type:complete len:205 (-) Transcript_1222:640-1254(-)|eukprot:CAMPEP_0171556296 /NCGR_PEP_ID=MMETSP0960-20121227/10636_1 /TAXON_ID=87120 /ORGANISM="Aurantiochytrium limacinum, Strain ATCCMYA-1381" /LENGTH=204 /DNA_ID=CAMNT_0012106517 /DNA_START=43 /DNA_END=657 /DNA_ORIENTATION=+